MSPLGGHFNPVVTLIFAARGATLWRDMLPYIIVQCAGGVAGAPAFTRRSPELRSTVFRVLLLLS
jgi:glycerol uptake facilitator-like aquaporin